MISYNGIGTTIYGKREVNQADGSYIATKWFIILFFPLVPLGSYRVIKAKQKFLSGSWPSYQMIPVEMNLRQVINTYLVWWGIPLLVIPLLITVAVSLSGNGR
jgi:hypothetical protein